MEELNRKQFDQWLQNSLGDYPSAVPVGGWKGLQNRRKKNRRRRIFWFGAVAALVALSIGGYQVLKPGMQVQQAGMDSQPEETYIPSIPENSPETSFPQTDQEAPTSGMSQSSAMQNSPGNVVPELPAPRLSTAIDTPEQKRDSLEPAIVGPIEPIPAGTITVKRGPDSIRHRFPHYRPCKYQCLVVNLGIPIAIRAYAGVEYETGLLKVENYRYGAEVHEYYRGLHLSNRIRQASRGFHLGLVANTRRGLSLSVGAGLSQTQWQGRYDFRKAGYDPDGFVNNWLDTQQLEDRVYKTVDYTALSLDLPIQFRYTLPGRIRPFVGVGLRMKWNLRENGRRFDPNTMEYRGLDEDIQGVGAAQVNEPAAPLSPRFQALPSFSAGLSLPVKHTLLHLVYTYSLNRRYELPGFQYRANTHAFSLQYELPF